MSGNLKQQALHRRARARELLCKVGHKVTELKKQDDLLRAIEVEMGKGRDCDADAWVLAYLNQCSKNAPRVQPREFRPLRLSPQWVLNTQRASQAQSQLLTPSGVGNGVEGAHGYGRGR